MLADTDSNAPVASTMTKPTSKKPSKSKTSPAASAAAADQQPDRSNLSAATISQYESYLKHFRQWCKQDGTPSTYAGALDNVTYHTPRAILAWTKKRLENATIKQAGTAISARSAFLWWLKPRIGAEAVAAPWKEQRVGNGKWKVSGNPLTYAPYEQYIEDLKKKMPKRIYHPRGRKSGSSDGKSKSGPTTMVSETAAGHPLRVESMLSASTMPIEGASRTNGRDGSNNATTSPTFARMVTSDSTSTMLSAASAGTPSMHTAGSVTSFDGHMPNGAVAVGTTSVPPPPPPAPAAAPASTGAAPHASPIWPHSTVLSPHLSECLCNSALFSSHSAAGHANFAPPHSYRCRYGAFTRGDLDIMINWLDARLQDGSYMSDVDRLRFEWLRAVLSLGFYLWALPREMEEVRLADVRTLHDRPFSASNAGPGAPSLTIAMQWRSISMPGAPSAVPMTRSYAVVNTSTMSASNRALDSLDRWLRVHANVWPQDRSGYLFPHVDNTGPHSVHQPLNQRTLHSMIKEITDFTRLTSKDMLFSSDAWRNGAMFDTLFNCHRRDSEDLRRWVSWAGCAWGEVPGHFAQRIQDEFVRISTSGGLADLTGQAFGAAEEVAVGALERRLSQAAPNTNDEGTKKRFLDAVTKLIATEEAAPTPQMWFEISKAAGDLGNLLSGGRGGPVDDDVTADLTDSSRSSFEVASRRNAVDFNMA